MPPDLLESRFAVAAAVADDLLAISAPVAVGVGGSTALGRCSAQSDLDLVAIVDRVIGPPVTTRTVDDVRVDVEWLSREQALADTEGDGWTWELRKGARLGGVVALVDPGDVFAFLAERSRAMRPDPNRYAAELRAAGALLDAVADGAGTARMRGEALRGLVDTLAMLRLLVLPRRYQKAKWTPDDLVDQGEATLAGAVLDAYRIDGEGADAAADAIDLVAALIAAVLERIGAPNAAALVAMGHAPDHLAASYVARTLADARDLTGTGRFAEARYVAGFAARLAAGLLDPASGGDLVERVEAAGIEPLYTACFAQGAVSARSIAAARAAAKRCEDWLIGQSVVPEAVCL